MYYESVEQALNQLRRLEQTRAAYQHALGVLELDGATSAPAASWEGRGITMGVLSEAIYNLMASEENGRLLSYLKDHEQELDATARRELEIVSKEYNQLYRIPQDEYIAFNILVNDAQANWEKAREANDFSLFQPFLEKIVGFNKKFAGYYNPELAPYDALMNLRKA